jgi:hypothetical protein
MSVTERIVWSFYTAALAAITMAFVVVWLAETL